MVNQTRLQQNASCYAEQWGGHPGAPRQGAALLQGLATCGCCGRRMRVLYKRGVRYACDGLTQNFGEPVCGNLDATSIEAFVVQSFFAAITPAQIDALADVLNQQQQERQNLDKYHQQQIQRAQYEVSLARKRYEQVDPENRLVASALERQWEDKLQHLQIAQEAANRFEHQPSPTDLSPEIRQRISVLSQQLPQLWQSEQCTHEQRKQLLRSLIARVIVQRIAPDQVQVKIVWVSGHFSEGVVVPPIWRQTDVSNYPEILQHIEDLWRQGYNDFQIAQSLNDAGFHSARNLAFTSHMVLKIRRQQQWLSPVQQHKGADKIDGMWTIQGLADHLGVSISWVYNRIRNGVLSPPELVRRPAGNYLILDDETLMLRLRQAVQQTRSLAKSHS